MPGGESWGATESRHVPMRLCCPHVLHTGPRMEPRALQPQGMWADETCTHPSCPDHGQPDLTNSTSTPSKLSYTHNVGVHPAEMPGQGHGHVALSLSHGKSCPELAKQRKWPAQTGENKWSRWLSVPMCSSHPGPEWKPTQQPHLLASCPLAELGCFPDDQERAGRSSFNSEQPGEG